MKYDYNNGILRSIIQIKVETLSPHYEKSHQRILNLQQKTRYIHRYIQNALEPRHKAEKNYSSRE